METRENYEFKFIVGRSYRRKDGKIVKIISESMGSGKNYRCVQGDDGAENFDKAPPGTYKSRAEAAKVSGYRYDRSGDVGRCTGGPDDNPHNLIPGAVDIRVGDKLLIERKKPYKTDPPTTRWEEVTEVGRKYFWVNGMKFSRELMKETADQNTTYTAYYTQQDYDDAQEYASLLATVRDEFRGYSTTHTLSLQNLRSIVKLLKLETK